MTTAKAEPKETAVQIKPPNYQTAVLRIKGTAPYVQHKFSAKAREIMRAKQEAGSTGKKGTKKEPKDFKAYYEGAMHKFADGSCGIPAPAFRAAAVSACRLVGFKMTLAKLAIFVEADGFDADDGTPLVKITKGKPHYHEAAVRLETGVVDIRPRPMWDAGWEADLRIRFDADVFTLMDVANLMARVGGQVGIGEGRPGSKESCGQGWGLFSVGEK